MNLTADDLWPLVLKLTHDEQVRLAKLALHAAARDGTADAGAYRTAPPGDEEFSSDEVPLAWEAEDGRTWTRRGESDGTASQPLTNNAPSCS